MTIERIAKVVDILIDLVIGQKIKKREINETVGLSTVNYKKIKNNQKIKKNNHFYHSVWKNER